MHPELTDDVYHYTSVDAALYGILGLGSIRLSPYESTNDPQESRPRLPALSRHETFIPGDTDDVTSLWNHADRWLRRSVKLACFTQDYSLPETAIDEDAFRGWAHSSAWAHYGDRHGGVCLRFNRPQLVEQFHTQLGTHGRCLEGAVEYPVQRFSALPTEPLDMGQIQEFGIDAVASLYVEKFHRELYFTKSHDWANESEFRLIFVDQSELPVYLDVTKCLTGVVLGDAFPVERIEVVRHLLDRMPNAALIQLRYHNGKPYQFPVIASDEPPGPTPRLGGTLSERFETLRAIETARAEAWVRGEARMGSLLSTLGQTMVEVDNVSRSWPEVEGELLVRTQAIAAEQRRRAPGVPGEVVEYESGWLYVVENLPRYSVTLVIGLAAQLFEGDRVRLHGTIKVEARTNSEVYSQVLLQTASEGAFEQGVTLADNLSTELLAQLPSARKLFDELRGTSGMP